MAQNEENGGNGARLALAVFSPVIIAAGFFVFPLLPAISTYLDGRSRTYTAAACVAVGCAALPWLLGAHAYALAAFIAVATAAAYVLARVKVPFSAGLVGSAAGGVLGAVVALGLLGAGFDRPLNEIGASLLCNGLSNMAHAGYPELLNYLAGTVKAADQGNYVGLFSIFNLFNLQALLKFVSGLSIDEQVAVVRPLLENLCAAYIPALALVGGMFVGAVGYYLPVLALDRRRHRINTPRREPEAEGGEAAANAPVPPFAAFKVPRYIVITLLLLQIVSSFMMTDASTGLTALSAASSMLFSSLMTVQALALASFLLNRRRVHALLQFILLALSVLLFMWLLPYVGIVDALFDIRSVTLRMDAIRAKGKQVFTQEGLDELRKMEQRKRGGRNGGGGNGGEDGTP